MIKKTDNNYQLSLLNELRVDDININELYYYDLILNIKPGKIIIQDDILDNLSKSILNVYSINYETFEIKDGKLNYL